MSVRMSMCPWCKHHRNDRTCEAFPERIPTDVYWGDHRFPVSGDHGIQFEMREGADPLLFGSFGPPKNLEKIRAVRHRVERCRKEMNQILKERGGDLRLGHRLAHMVEFTEDFDDFPEEMRHLILAAEARMK